MLNSVFTSANSCLLTVAYGWGCACAQYSVYLFFSMLNSVFTSANSSAHGCF